MTMLSKKPDVLVKLPGCSGQVVRAKRDTPCLISFGRHCAGVDQLVVKQPTQIGPIWARMEPSGRRAMSSAENGIALISTVSECGLKYESLNKYSSHGVTSDQPQPNPHVECPVHDIYRFRERRGGAKVQKINIHIGFRGDKNSPQMSTKLSACAYPAENEKINIVRTVATRPLSCVRTFLFLVITGTNSYSGGHGFFL